MLSPGGGVDCEAAVFDGSLGGELLLEGDCACFAAADELSDLDSSLVDFAALPAGGF